ncbi:N-(5'-phosphoribosyl)anthranilate isomerase [Hyphomicrobium denitrificans 1NES1]|uniref:N-(5'-phosphoribosyl)anthranilate isomerase n=1 Tax=Hyphomicrobium denitrificans 1NES1 TaxID=670307 RepID=N0B8L3_9HYPH|nr:phosphoribosylanthranilate isomerase [Hyphomicrobium denitrificans]AGK58587.1 N-(5'-phosphoribosyl)anthranilate isomerase [Hyphomicrobium denitrificans 1NES1]
MTTKTKICGLNTREALAAAIDGGADYVGFVFFAPSPRHLEIAAARRLAEQARGRGDIVALTVDATDAVLDEIAKEIAPDFLQLHGSETPERVVEVKEKFGCKIIKAMPVRTSEDAALAKTYTKVADLILFDAKAPSGATRPGGHGQAFDWAVLDAVSRDIPFMLSGGLTPDNVQEAIRATCPQSVDVSSGVETAPGVKDADLIRRFLQAVKTANQS